MSYSRWAALLVTFCLASSPGQQALASSGVFAVNGSLTNRLSIGTSAGVCSIPAGQGLDWTATPGDTVTNSVDGAVVGTWTFTDGHDYVVQLGQGTPVSVIDKGVIATGSFYRGFAFMFIACLLALGSRFAKATVTDNGFNE